jgi:hypothetical protein
MSDRMRVGMLAPVAMRVPPLHYGPWERVVSILTEGLVARGGCGPKILGVLHDAGQNQLAASPSSHFHRLLCALVRMDAAKEQQVLAGAVGESELVQRVPLVRRNATCCSAAPWSCCHPSWTYPAPLQCPTSELLVAGGLLMPLRGRREWPLPRCLWSCGPSPVSARPGRQGQVAAPTVATSGLQLSSHGRGCSGWRCSERVHAFASLTSSWPSSRWPGCSDHRGGSSCRATPTSAMRQRVFSAGSHGAATGGRGRGRRNQAWG